MPKLIDVYEKKKPKMQRLKTYIERCEEVSKQLEEHENSVFGLYEKIFSGIVSEKVMIENAKMQGHDSSYKLGMNRDGIGYVPSYGCNLSMYSSYNFKNLIDALKLNEKAILAVIKRSYKRESAKTFIRHLKKYKSLNDILEKCEIKLKGEPFALRNTGIDGDEGLTTISHLALNSDFYIRQGERNYNDNLNPYRTLDFMQIEAIYPLVVKLYKKTIRTLEKEVAKRIKDFEAMKEDAAKYLILKEL